VTYESKGQFFFVYFDFFQKCLQLGVKIIFKIFLITCVKFEKRKSVVSAIFTRDFLHELTCVKFEKRSVRDFYKILETIFEKSSVVSRF